jgi:hypothetical protein
MEPPLWGLLSLLWGQFHTTIFWAGRTQGPGKPINPQKAPTTHSNKAEARAGAHTRPPSAIPTAIDPERSRPEATKRGNRNQKRTGEAAGATARTTADVAVAQIFCVLALIV